MLAQDATVTVLHKESGDLRPFLQNADVVVVATGVPGLVRGDDLEAGRDGDRRRDDHRRRRTSRRRRFRERVPGGRRDHARSRRRRPGNQHRFAAQRRQERRAHELGGSVIPNGTNVAVSRNDPSGAASALARTRAARPEGRRPHRLSRNGALALDDRSRDAGEPYPRNRNGLRLFDALDGARAAAHGKNLDDRAGYPPYRRRAIVLPASRRRRLHRNFQHAYAGASRELSPSQPRHRLYRCRHERISQPTSISSFRC